jgi:hypothetical protein
MAKLIIQEKLILANPKVKDSQADKFRAMALPGADEHYRSSVQYAYKNMDTRLYKSTKGGGFHDKVKASAKRHILDKFADHGITPNHAHIDRELDKAMAHWNKTQKGLKMKGVTESKDMHALLTRFGYKRTEPGLYDHSDGHQVQMNHPSGIVHIMGKSNGPYENGATINIKDYDDMEDHLMSIHPYYHGKGN